MANNLWEAAALATGPRSEPAFEAPMLATWRRQRTRYAGCICGGTLAEEAEAVLVARGAPHQVIDFGDDRYTRGRAHPMIDPTLRNTAIVEAGADPSVAVLLLDVMLGLGSHADPAGATVPAIREARARAEADGRTLALLAHIVGTDGDAQGLARQQAALRAAGVQLYESNYHAALAACPQRGWRDAAVARCAASRPSPSARRCSPTALAQQGAAVQQRRLAAAGRR